VSDRRQRSRPGKGGSRPSPAALGLVRVDADFEQEFPDADRSSTEAYASLVRTGVALSAELDRSILATFDVPHPVVTALAVVEGAGEPLTPSQISERVLVPSATMTATLDVLESRGWVVRRPNAADRRSLLVDITDEGRAVADRLLPGIRQVESKVLSALSEPERRQLLRLLDKVLVRAADVAAEPPALLDGRRRRPRGR
jgi:DNA-binding MarR family transcriptional regulator